MKTRLNPLESRLHNSPTPEKVPAKVAKPLSRRNMKAIFTTGIIWVMVLLMHTELLAQKAIGNFVLSEGKIKVGPYQATVTNPDGTKEKFTMETYDGDIAESPRGRNGERLAGFMVKYRLNEKHAVDLQSPTDGQKIVLLKIRPEGITNSFASKITVTKAEARKATSESRNSIVYGTGYVAMGVAGGPGGGSPESLTGCPYSEIDLSQLRNTAGYIDYFGRRWRPKPEGESLIIVTWDNVFGVNVEADPQPASDPPPKETEKK